MPPSEFRRDVAADQQQVAAEFLHQVELALGALEGALPLRFRHAFEIAKRLERDALQAEVRHLPGDVGRRAVEGEQIVLENLDAAETGRGDRFQLFAQTAAEANRGDRGFHDFVLRLAASDRLRASAASRAS